MLLGRKRLSLNGRSAFARRKSAPGKTLSSCVVAPFPAQAPVVPQPRRKSSAPFLELELAGTLIASASHPQKEPAAVPTLSKLLFASLRAGPSKAGVALLLPGGLGCGAGTVAAKRDEWAAEHFKTVDLLPREAPACPLSTDGQGHVLSWAPPAERSACMHMHKRTTRR